MTDLPSYYSAPLALAYPQCSVEQQRALRLLLCQACPGTLLRSFLRPHLQQKEPPASIIESIDLEKHFVYGNQDTIGLLPFLFQTVQSEKANTI